MENTHGDTNIIDTQEQYIEYLEAEQKEFSEDKNDNFITEEELEHIYPDINHNFPSSTMNSGIMIVYHNDPEHLIDDPKYFRQYHS